jgi:hypothetical protein
VKPLDIRTEYAAVATGWHAFVNGPKALEDAPLAVLLLHAIAGDHRTGNPLADVLGALADMIAGWRAVGQGQGGGVVQLDLSEVRLAERRAHVVAELLRRREQLFTGGPS